MKFLYDIFAFTGFLVWCAVAVMLFLIWIGRIEVGVDTQVVEKKDD